MKNFALIAKIVTAIAAVVGFAYIIATVAGGFLIIRSKGLQYGTPHKGHCNA